MEILWLLETPFGHTVVETNSKGARLMLKSDMKQICDEEGKPAQSKTGNTKIISHMCKVHVQSYQ